MPKFLLHEACQNGEIEKVKSLVRKKWDINGFDDKHWTPLHCAANARQLEICKYLISKGANPTLTTSNNATALHYLARMKDHALLLPLLKAFLDKGADVNHPNTHASTPLHEAALRGAVSCMQFLLSHGAKVDVQNSYGETPLHHAVRSNTFGAVELLVRKGAKVDIVGREGTALEQAQRLLDEETYRQIENLIGRVAETTQSIVNFETLPQAVVDLATQAKISRQQIDQNFDLFTDVVRFISGSKLLPEPVDRFNVTFEPGNPNDLYKIESSLSGSGGYGAVHIAKNLKTKQLVAIKKTSNKTAKEFKMNTNELRLLKRCQHKNIVLFLEAYNLIDLQEIWSVMEYMEGGTLNKLLSKVTLKEKQIAYIVKEILEGLKWLHTKFVIHRDIKSHNIMLTVQGDVKIVDFGLAMDLRKGSQHKVAGSALWMAPEVIRREPQSFPVDIWSLGITIVEMLTGEPPNADNKLRAMYHAALGEVKPELKNPESYSPDLHHFLEECLRADPSQRPTCEMLLQHRWLEKTCRRETMIELISKAFLKQELNDMGIGI